MSKCMGDYISVAEPLCEFWFWICFVSFSSCLLQLFISIFRTTYTSTSETFFTHLTQLFQNQNPPIGSLRSSSFPWSLTQGYSFHLRSCCPCLPTSPKDPWWCRMWLDRKKKNRKGKKQRGRGVCPRLQGAEVTHNDGFPMALDHS